MHTLIILIITFYFLNFLLGILFWNELKQDLFDNNFKRLVFTYPLGIIIGKFLFFKKKNKDLLYYKRYIKGTNIKVQVIDYGENIAKVNIQASIIRSNLTEKPYGTKLSNVIYEKDE